MEEPKSWQTKNPPKRAVIILISSNPFLADNVKVPPTPELQFKIPTNVQAGKAWNPLAYQTLECM
jgi:hypothetical protein